MKATGSTPLPAMIAPPAPAAAPDDAVDQFDAWYDPTTGDHSRRRRLCDDCSAGYHPKATHGSIGCLRTTNRTRAEIDHVCKCDQPNYVN